MATSKTCHERGAAGGKGFRWTFFFEDDAGLSGAHAQRSRTGFYVPCAASKRRVHLRDHGLVSFLAPAGQPPRRSGPEERSTLSEDFGGRMRRMYDSSKLAAVRTPWVTSMRLLICLHHRAAGHH